MVALLKEDGCEGLLQEVYQDCVAQASRPAAEMVNHVKRLYDRYTDEQISAKIAQLVYPKNVPWQGELEIVFLTVDKMKSAIPVHNGDWYFTPEIIRRPVARRFSTAPTSTTSKIARDAPTRCCSSAGCPVRASGESGPSGADSPVSGLATGSTASWTEPRPCRRCPSRRRIPALIRSRLGLR